VFLFHLRMGPVSNHVCLKYVRILLFVVFPGFLVRSLLDSGKFTWYDAIHDVVEPGGNLFELLRTADTIAQRACQVLVRQNKASRWTS
jgi:hypothetical protein